MLAVLREAAFAKLVLLCRLEVQRRHVVEAYRHLTAYDLLRVLIGYPFDKSLVVRLFPLPAIIVLESLSDCTAHSLLILFFQLPLLPAVTEVVKETVDFAQAVSDMEIAFQIVHGLQLAARIEQAADDHVTEHVACYLAITDIVIEPAKDHFRANHLYLRVVQLAQKTLIVHLLLIDSWQQGLVMAGDIVAPLCHKAL